jgi:hypothetical protein
MQSIKRQLIFALFLVALFLFITTSCGMNNDGIKPVETETLTPGISYTATPMQMPSPTSTPQPRSIPIAYGPDLENFPAGVNPLTGLAVEDPSWLKLPAVLVSVSNMPVTARPQAGLSFASWIFEFYVGQGATRFMSVFYGGAPREIPNVSGGCKPKSEIIRPQSEWIGNRVWLDENENGRQDDWEAGIANVCVLLFRNNNYEQSWDTTTDSNGYYSLDLPKDNNGKPLDGDYELRFEVADAYKFTKPNVGDDDHDSDVDPLTKQTSVFKFTGTDTSLDAGLILSEKPVPTPTISITGTPPNWYIPKEPYIGPIRSGRLTYNKIGAMFWNSCLVYASAAWDIGTMLDGCEIIHGVDAYTPNSALLTVTRLRELAEKNVVAGQPVNYSGNIFSEDVPDNGKPATDINVYYHDYTQSAWRYDPVSKSYLRWTDLADGNGTLVPATDRLTGRQLASENLIVLFAEHERYRHNQFEINLGSGQGGYAYLFRDGQMFPIRWTTINRKWEQQTGLPRPLYFLDSQNNPIALHPGQTWIHLVTPFSYVEDKSNGNWLIRFVQAADPYDTPVP